MGLNFFRRTGTLLLAASIMPCGMLLAKESRQPATVKTSNANWYDVEQASQLFNRMNSNALKVRREVGPLQVQGSELNWREHAVRLQRVKNHINNIGDELQSLNQIKNRLEPWQQRLVNKVTVSAHEMAYQTDAALNTLRGREDRHTLKLTQYPNNINKIYQNANQMTNTIQSVTQAAQGEQMSALNGVSRTNPGS